MLPYAMYGSVVARRGECRRVEARASKPAELAVAEDGADDFGGGGGGVRAACCSWVRTVVERARDAGCRREILLKVVRVR